MNKPTAANEPRCDYCGLLGWTVNLYGRVTHKESCPHRTDPWHQGDPDAGSAANEFVQEAATANPDGESGKANLTDGSGAPSHSNAPSAALVRGQALCAHTEFECDCDCPCGRFEHPENCGWPDCSCGCDVACKGCSLVQEAQGV